VTTAPDHQQRLLAVLSLVFVFSLVWALWPFITNPTSVTDAYRSAGVFAPVVFLVLVAVAPTPGAIVGASGVAYFGQWQGMLLLYVGNVLAVLLTFAIVRSFGRPAIERFLEPTKLAKADAFLTRHPFLLWFVYAIPVFPLEIITAVIALSSRKLRHFIIIPLLALPIDAFIVTSIGDLLSENLFVIVEYASIAVVILLVSTITHFLYRWKREEIAEVGRVVTRNVKRSVDGVRGGARRAGVVASAAADAAGRAAGKAFQDAGSRTATLLRRRRKP
jgi:uncharacterized membrane protein YdjX (TVP38/TMEM64 family)